jgi:SAM-dependent methyltransferase
MNGVSPRWEQQPTVAGFATGGPNDVLVAYARRFVGGTRQPRCLDIGCGAARNALPLARLGFRVVAADLSAPMIDAARTRVAASPEGAAVDLVLAPMSPLPFADATFDLIVAHGVWNLATSGAMFRSAIQEASRVARPGAGLFLFTFSRNTISADARPDAGESFVFSCWNGEPQCFLSEAELIEELARAGFERDTPGPLTEYNVSAARLPRIRGGPPVIYEGTFVRSGTSGRTD